MKTKLYLFVLFSLLALSLAACGPSPEQVNATATQVAANIFGTQTAQAPTATSTNTPTPTATSTPTPTPTSTPTSTPTVTPTPTPDILEATSLTIDDLPPGFEDMPSSQLKDMQKQLPEGATGFGFMDQENFTMILGFIIPVETSADQSSFDAAMPQFTKLYATVVGADQNTKDLTGIDSIGESRAGITAVGPLYSISMRWDIITFRRRSEVVMLIVGYDDTKKPDISIQDLAQLMDERMILYLMPSIFAAPANADSLAGSWSGEIVAEDGSLVSELQLEILEGCTVGSGCGTYSAVDIPCSGDLTLEATNGNTFIFAETLTDGSADCTEGGHEYIRLLTNGKLFWKFEAISPTGKVMISKAILEKK